MKSGKVSDTVLKRSILKEVQKVNQGTNLPLVGGGAGACLQGGREEAAHEKMSDINPYSIEYHNSVRLYFTCNDNVLTCNKKSAMI